MSRILHLCIRLLLVAVLVPLALALNGTSASAYTNYPYRNCYLTHALGWPKDCTAWTGGYPSGLVRVESAPYYEDLKLQKCSQARLAGCRVTTVASSTGHKGYTPSVTPTKISWYRPCSRLHSDSPWYCGGWTWLGD
jgi:hypothetical protein